MSWPDILIKCSIWVAMQIPVGGLTLEMDGWWCRAITAGNEEGLTKAMESLG